MLTYNTHLMNQLRKLIQVDIQNKMEDIISSHSAMDFAAFKYQVGIIEGLRKALDFVDEAESIVEGKEPTRGN